MTRQGSFLELRPFSGTSLGDCINYLRRDVAKCFADLFIILNRRNAVGDIVTDSKSATSHTTGQYATRGAVTLTAGTWDICGFGAIVPAATTTVTRFDVGISMTDGDDDANLVDLENLITTFYPASYVPTDQVSATVGPWRVVVPSQSTNPTFYLKIYTTFATSTLQSKGFIRATKVRE